jgi:hypothetical protein
MVRVLRTLILGLVLSLTLLTSQTRAVDTLRPISITILSHQKPHQIELSIIIPTHPDNRQACLSVEGEDYFSSGCWEVGPPTTQAQFVRLFKGMPRGEYLATARLKRGGSVYSALLGFVAS